MRPFSKVIPQLWNEKKFKSLSSSDAKLAMLYFMTGPHQNSAGCYRLPDGYAAADLGWDVPRYVEARKSVVAADLIVFDEETTELYVIGWFKENPVTNDRHKMGCERQINMMDSSVVHNRAGDEMEASEQDRNDAKRRRKSRDGDVYDPDTGELR